MSFGTYLIQARELRGLALGDVAERTKIPASALEALESDAGSRLPERVYVLGYLRAYADAVGLDPDEVALRFEEAHPAASEVAAPPEVLTTRRPGVALAVILGVGAVILAVVAILLLRR